MAGVLGIGGGTYVRARIPTGSAADRVRGARFRTWTPTTDPDTGGVKTLAGPEDRELAEPGHVILKRMHDRILILIEVNLFDVHKWTAQSGLKG